jgi:hypothetical protein
MRKGKMSSIRRKSNKMFNYYDKNGNIKLEKLNKKETKKYIELKKNEQILLEEKNRLPKIRKKINGKWVILKRFE